MKKIRGMMMNKPPHMVGVKEMKKPKFYLTGSTRVCKAAPELSNFLISVEITHKKLTDFIRERLEKALESNPMLDKEWLKPTGNGAKPYYIDEVNFNTLGDKVLIHGTARPTGSKTKIACGVEIDAKTFYKMLFNYDAE